MTIVVETGAIVDGANAYITVAELDAYWSARNVTLSQTNAEKEAAIIIATQYVDINFSWRGTIVIDEQWLDWPRAGVYDDEGRDIEYTEIPRRLKNAVCEYAKRQLDSDIQPDVFPNDLGAIKRKREKVDVIEQEVEYQDNTGGYYGIKRYPLADNWLKGLTIGGTMGSFGQVRRC